MHAGLNAPWCDTARTWQHHVAQATSKATVHNAHGDVIRIISFTVTYYRNIDLQKLIETVVADQNSNGHAEQFAYRLREVNTSYISVVKR